MADATFSHKETHNSSSVLAAALYVQTMGCFQALAAGNMQQDVMQYLQAAGIAYVKVSQPAGAPQARQGCEQCAAAVRNSSAHT
jgi:hypothetical protein